MKDAMVKEWRHQTALTKSEGKVEARRRWRFVVVGSRWLGLKGVRKKRSGLQ
ncbi:uncharacterized protein G2W53_032936 [Senna tora]|uniref:Uncharacterized protein n=1 Tax=Senna tora TaxID=362788 RepID=A0A834SXD1_9FABA|nr:uncharacterized protein G2W53_032936 [Senna tora]